MDKKINRNDPCPCGSGKKYKNCCMNQSKESTTPNALEKLKQRMKQKVHVIQSGFVDFTEKTFEQAIRRGFKEERPPEPETNELLKDKFPEGYKEWDEKKEDF